VQIEMPRAADDRWMTTEANPQTGKTAYPKSGNGLLSYPVVVAAAFAALIYCMTPGSMADPDIWWHLRNAEYMFHAHAWIAHDMYSFTAAGAPWMDHEWLAEIPFYLGWRAMGERGVLLVTAVAIEAVMLGIFWLAYRRSGSLKAAAVVSTVGALLATVSFGPRTLLFGWICLVAELVVLERFRRDARWAWALPVLFAVWVNTHGSWLIGMVLLCVFLLCGSVGVFAGEIESPAWTRLQTRTLASATCASLAALLLNPYGWRLVAYPFNLAFHQKLNIAHVEEWHSLDFHTMRGRLFLGCIASLFLLQLVRRRRWMLYEVAFLCIGVYSAMNYSRFLFLAAILIMPLMAVGIPGLGASRVARKRPAFNAVLLVALAPLTALRAPAKTPMATSPDAAYPVQAMDYLRDFQPKGNVFNEYTWGGFLAYHARQIPVMIDSRADIFEYNGAFKDYLDAIALKNPAEVMEKYKIRYVLFGRNTPLVLFITQTSAWKVDYEDGTTVLLERASPLDDAL
jgi:hypothetical protein